MEKILNVAEYIFKEYQRVTGEYIDEMKLQKLLIFFTKRKFSYIKINQCLVKNFEGGNTDQFSREVRT